MFILIYWRGSAGLNVNQIAFLSHSLEMMLQGHPKIIHYFSQFVDNLQPIGLESMEAIIGVVLGKLLPKRSKTHQNTGLNQNWDYFDFLAQMSI